MLCQSSYRRGALMNAIRFRFSSAVPALVILGASVLPMSAGALQLYSRAVRPGSNAVANHADSVSGAVSAAGGSLVADSAESGKKALFSPSGEKGSGLSGKVFARFVLPEDWISLASLPGSSVSDASIQGSPSGGAETVFTMRSFGQKVRAWLNGYRLGYWPQEKGRLRSEAYKNPDG